jgi:AbiTii
MTLLKEIQAAAIDSSVDVVQVLRKCRVLASRLSHDDLKAWVQKELDGYADGEELPDYRIKRCQSKGNFVGFAGRQLNNAPIPTQNLPEPLRESISQVRFRESVSALQNLAQTGDRDSFGSAWPTELIAPYAEEFYEDFVLVQAYQVIPRNAFVWIIETVRNRVLNFALEIEAADPSAGEALPGSQPLPEQKVTQIFNNYISGNVGNIASGSGIVHQSAVLNVARGDDDALKRALGSIGVPDIDGGELAKAIKADPPLTTAAAFGPKVSKWLGALVTKAARGGLKVTADVATQTVTALIKSYCGI